MVDRLLALPVPFFRDYTVGDLASRARAVNMVRDLLGGVAATSIVNGAFATVYLGLLFWYSWKLALVAIGLVLLALTFTILFAMRAVRFQRQQQAVAGKISGLVFQLINGVGKLRVSGSEGRAFAVWCGRFREQKDLAYRAGVAQNVVMVFNSVLPLLAVGVLFGVAGWLSTSGESMSTGQFVAFNSAFGTFFASAVALSGTLVSVLVAIPILERAEPILRTLPETSANQPDAGELTGRIEGTHLTFRYREDGPVILRDVSFQARPGEFIAFVGPSGSGKSTTLRMLLGFEKPETGAVYYDGQDLATVDISGVRAQIGVVLQSSRLTSGDVFQNIIGSAPLSLDDAWEAAEMAGLAEDIRAMPMQMHTVISEGGSTLSGGQRQRLLIARALARKPRIIFFDEATSALDNRTQEQVSLSLERTNATRIVIAHRLSTIRNADRIYVMDQGEVVQEGSFEELVQRPGMFAQLVRRQMA
jgi:NHLM bacteriocin system ABC transporter ATP-binding protein